MNALVRERSFVEDDCDDISDRIQAMQAAEEEARRFARSLRIVRRKDAEPPKQPDQLWPRWYSPPQRACPSDALIRWVSEQFCVPPQSVRKPGRQTELLYARAVVIDVLHRWGWSWGRIGRVFGGKDHSTVIHAYRNLPHYALKNPELGAITHEARAFFAPYRRKHR